MTARPFSAASRHHGWTEVTAGDTFDLLVVGGGITGMGIARDAACRGLRVVVIDRGDIGSGTSSVSSRLVHGGLRYLETFEFGLVFEALRERRRLIRAAPHLVHPLPFLFPVFRGDPTGVVKLAAGMWLYELLSLFRSPRRHRLLGRRGALSAEPLLNSEGLKGGALYYDAQVDDARLTLAVARAAHDAGARVISHAEISRLEPVRGSSSIAEIRDGLSGRRGEIRAQLIVNATGPWSDAVRRLADPAAAPRLRTTKGVHVLLPRERVGNRGAIIFRSRVDGRVMFVLPWGEFTYVGTTDTEFAGDPGDAVAEAADVRYLLDSANGVFPGANLSPEDVLSTWAGVRPLLAPRGSAGVGTSATSREHDIWRDPSGLLNVAGGKLTTFRSMAAEVVDRAVEILRAEHEVASGSCYTEYLPLPGAYEDSEEDFLQEMRSRGADAGLGGDTVGGLVGRHGSEAGRVLDLIEDDPELARRIAPARPYLLAEAVHAVRHEMALTLDDIMRRRLQLCYELRDGGTAQAELVARTVAAEEGIGWDAAEIERQTHHYARVVERTRPPARVPSG